MMRYIGALALKSMHHITGKMSQAKKSRKRSATETNCVTTIRRKTYLKQGELHKVEKVIVIGDLSGMCIILCPFYLFYYCECILDVNECSTQRNLCTNGQCVNTEGSFYCVCRDGSELTPDRTQCLGKKCRVSRSYLILFLPPAYAGR